MASVWLNEQYERELALVGYVLPPYPKSGPITIDGNEVGMITNFEGITTRNKLLVETCEYLGMAVWNPDEVD